LIFDGEAIGLKATDLYCSAVLGRNLRVLRFIGFVFGAESSSPETGSTCFTVAPPAGA
jgi:hypothetical protein